MKPALHENLDRDEPIVIGSNRAFAVVMAIFFVILGLWLRWVYGLSWPWVGVFVAVALAFVLVEWLADELLTPLNRLWHRLGLLLGAIVSPLILGLIFFIVLTPIAWLRRLGRSHSLALNYDYGAATYWQERQPPGPEPEHLPRQF